jgi:glycosyltransferase involved in cell wall biosynthesis
MEMSLSIGIPCFNQAQYLTEAIESALAQTVPCEVIVCNDGSTDNTLEVAKSYESRGVKVINQINKGLSSARNSLIMNATGDYFLPLDADDLLLENAAERILAAGDFDVIAPSFKAFGVYNQELLFQAIPTMEDFLTANRLGYFSAVKRSVLLEVGGYSPRMQWGWEDYALWIDILKRGKTLTVIPEVLVLYRTKETSMITEANKHAEELYAQMRKDHPDLPWK